MSRRGGSKQSDPPHSSAPSPSGRARGRGRGRGRTEHFAPSPAPTAAPLPSAAPIPTLGAQVPSQPVQVSSAPVPESQPVASLASTFEKQLTVMPSSSKAVRFPDRPGFGRAGKKIRVRANHFQVQVAQQDLYHYDVSKVYRTRVAITPEIPSKKVSRDVIGLLVQAHRESMLGNRIPAYDGRKSLYTAGPLPFESKDFKVKLGDDDELGPGSTSSPLIPARKKREREFRVTIRFAAKTDLNHLSQFLNRRQLDCPQETIQALDVVLRAAPSERFDVVGRSFFSPKLGPKGTLGSGTEYWRGYYQSLRPTQMGMSLNIDVSARAFYEAIPVLEFISKHFRLNLDRPLHDQDRIKIKKALRGVKVQVSHGLNIRRHKVTGVTTEPLRNLMFTLDDNRARTSVVQYFQEKYNISLRYTQLPALQAGSDTKPIFLPLEICQIVAGQRYTKKLNEDQVTALLRATCQRPRDREISITQIVRQSNFRTDKFAKQFQIQVREDPAVLEARVLPPPMLKYHGAGGESQVEPRMGQWNMINKKMIRGGTVEYWTCLNLSARIHRDAPGDFCHQLAEMCNSKGMRFKPSPLVPITTSQSGQIENALMNVHRKCQGTLQLLIIILPDVKGFYERIKRICETELGIVSQCCRPNQVMKMNKQYLENLALKINVKVGGTNTILNDAFVHKIPHVSDKPTIILGADVTHPQPGEDTSPSIAAVVASMDWPYVTKYRGVVSAQKHREEIIQDLYTSHSDPVKGLVHSGSIRDLFRAFRNSTGQKPHRIIFYRDGVSEGQFNQVLLYEMDAIRKACSSLEDGYLPPVTFVVVQKRHHTRLFPEDHGSRDQTDRSGNILPGTVVDTTICHPREFDFYLNSHAGIQGTSRPTHYHVLYDENKFTADELQIFTNNLCYTYARCTRSVSIVPPAYYAHLAAFRARCYIDKDISDAGSATGGKDGGTHFEVKLPSVKGNVQDVMFFC
ncbi:unnamed protein product [Sphenostylis stenocarpa]|uniref:Protein argonaute 5 n=1 Tax=Sphenostylis stenocarpa TaxID=92480 RepID=A0AA87B9U2_9FABA|nr:unnamed protein product [Sphenostylis stenocarpa]